MTLGTIHADPTTRLVTQLGRYRSLFCVRIALRYTSLSFQKVERSDEIAA